MPNLIKKRTKEKKETFSYPQDEKDSSWPKNKKQAKEMIEEHNKQYIHDDYHSNARKGKLLDIDSEFDEEELCELLKTDVEYLKLKDEQGGNEEAMRKAGEGRNYMLQGQLWKNRWVINEKISKRYKELREKTRKNQKSIAH